MGKNQNPQFAMIPFKLFRLGLDPFEFTAFAALRKHGDKDGQDIYPTLATLRSETGMSRDRLCKSLAGLRDLGIIEWQTGNSHRANSYKILPMGLWRSRKGTPHVPFEGYATRTTTVRQADEKGTPHVPHLDPVPRSMNYSADAQDERDPTPEEVQAAKDSIQRSLANWGGGKWP